MTARVAVVVFPGTNSEDETLRALAAAGVDAEIVHWSRGSAALRAFDAYVLPGGFAYEDRVRAGAVAAHDEVMDAVIAGAQAGQVRDRHLQRRASVARERARARDRDRCAGRPRRSRRTRAASFVSSHVHVRLGRRRRAFRCCAGLAADAVIRPGRRTAKAAWPLRTSELDALEREGHVAFVYCDARGERVARQRFGPRRCRPDQRDGNVLAIMPHPERDAWTFMHRDGDATKRRARQRARDARALRRNPLL